MPKIGLRNNGDSRSEEKQIEGKPLYLQMTNMYAPAWGYGGPVRLMFDYARWMSKDFEVAIFTSNLHHDFTRISTAEETISAVNISRHSTFFPRLAKKSVYLLSPKMCLRAAQRIRSSRGR